MEELTQIDLSEDKSESPTIRATEENLSMQPKKSKSFTILVTCAILAGLVTGFLLAKNKLQIAGEGGPANAQTPGSPNDLKAGETFGSDNTELFTDEAEGIIQPGGFEGEGSHHIVRGADESQWIYITSSTVDLDLFAGTKVHVWGQTNTPKKVGWLMDVGRLKVLSLKAAEVDAVTPLESVQPIGN